MSSPLSRMLDAIQRSPTLWHRVGAASRRADLYAALVGEELAEQPEAQRAGLLEARMVPPVGPWERLLTYGQWCKERAAEVADEGVVGGGKGEGWWPAAAGREEREDADESADSGGQAAVEAIDKADDEEARGASGPVAGEPHGDPCRGLAPAVGAGGNGERRARTREQLTAGSEAEERIAALRAEHGKAVRVRWGRRHTDAYGTGEVSYPAEEG